MLVRRVEWMACLVAGVALAAAPGARAQSLTLVEDGRARVSIVVPGAGEGDAAGLAARPQPPRPSPEDPVLLRAAAEDLAHYLGRMSGAEPRVDTRPIDGLVPIYVGDPPEPLDLPETSEFGDAYLIDVGSDRVVLTGESARATYYAAARLLHQLGVRWYAPGPLGEHVPAVATLELPIGRTASAPDYQTRNLWGRDAEEQRWLLRNRMGGPQMPQGHAFADFQRPLDSRDAAAFFEARPDFFPVMGGEVRRFQANLSNPEVARHVAAHLRRQLDRPTRWAGGTGAGIGPDDGPILDERPESQAIIRGRRDPLMRLPDATDLFIGFANAVARELEDEYPDHRLGFYVYSNHAGVPADEKPHEMLFPIITPITFSRYSSIGNPRVPTSMLLADITRRWAALSEDVGFYLYNFNLADVAMPFTRTLTFSRDIPRLYRWGLRYGSVESMPNWHTMVPGNYVLANLMWDVEADPQALASEVYANYFGPAAEAMRAYHEVLEQAYETTDAHAGGTWATHRILSPRVMERLGGSIAEAEAAASGHPPFEARVAVMRYSLGFATHWLAAREAMNDFRFADAAAAAEAFLAHHEAARGEYPLFFADDIARYFNAYHAPSFKEARRVEEEGRTLYRFPDAWKAFFDEDKVGHRMGLGDPRSLASNWIDLKTYSATLDEQGFPHFRGLVWYRHAFELPRLAADAPPQGLFALPDEAGPSRVKLWIGGADSVIDVYLNGEHLGQWASRRFGPVDIDITDAARPGGRNTLILAIDNTEIAELGTGGLMRPVVIYQPR